MTLPIALSIRDALPELPGQRFLRGREHCRLERIQVSSARILAAALSLSATGAFMVLFDVSHPPAGATTLIVSLGIISKPHELVIIEVAVFLLVAQAWLIHRLAGLPYPLWNTGATGCPVRMSD